MKQKFNNFLTSASFIALVIHLIIKFSFTNHQSEIFSAQNIPLLLVIIICGVPLLLEIIIKAFKGDVGSDLLAAIALIAAVILGQFLAANLIILMLASGKTLESYASKKASFALFGTSSAHSFNCSQKNQ